MAFAAALAIAEHALLDLRADRVFPVALVTLPVLDAFHMTAIRYGITAIIFAGLLALIEGPRALKMEGRGLRVALLEPTFAVGRVCSDVR